MAVKLGKMLIKGTGTPPAVMWPYKNKQLVQYHNQQFAQVSNVS